MSEIISVSFFVQEESCSLLETGEISPDTAPGEFSPRPRLSHIRSVAPALATGGMYLGVPGGMSSGVPGEVQCITGELHMD